MSWEGKMCCLHVYFLLSRRGGYTVRLCTVYSRDKTQKHFCEWHWRQSAEAAASDREGDQLRQSVNCLKSGWKGKKKTAWWTWRRSQNGRADRGSPPADIQTSVADNPETISTLFRTDRQIERCKKCFLRITSASSFHLHKSVFLLDTEFLHNHCLASLPPGPSVNITPDRLHICMALNSFSPCSLCVYGSISNKTLCNTPTWLHLFNVSSVLDPEGIESLKTKFSAWKQSQKLVQRSRIRLGRLNYIKLKGYCIILTQWCQKILPTPT